MPTATWPMSASRKTAAEPAPAARLPLSAQRRGAQLDRTMPIRLRRPPHLVPARSTRSAALYAAVGRGSRLRPHTRPIARAMPATSSPLQPFAVRPAPASLAPTRRAAVPPRPLCTTRTATQCASPWTQRHCSTRRRRQAQRTVSWDRPTRLSSSALADCPSSAARSAPTSSASKRAASSR